jgi:hypothetical protein
MERNLERPEKGRKIVKARVVKLKQKKEDLA